MQFQVTYVKITKQGINHTFETFRESGLEISLNHDKYDQISITNRQVLYEDIKVFPGSVTAWQKSATEMWFKYMTLKVEINNRKCTRDFKYIFCVHKIWMIAWLHLSVWES